MSWAPLNHKILVFGCFFVNIILMGNNKKQSVADLIEPYAGEWVALTSSQTAIVAHSKNLKAALKQAHQKGEEFPHMVKAPTESTASAIY